MDFQVWYNELPFVTKHYMILAFATAALISFQVLSASYLYVDFETLFTKFQLWRLFTNFFVFGKFSFPFLFKLILLYFGLSKSEGLFRPGRYAEFFYLIICNSLIILILGLIFHQYFLGTSLSFCFLYIWCKRVPFEKVQFLFGFLVTSAWLPWVILLYSVITGGTIVEDLIGLASGHLYILLKDYLPVSHGYNILKTPQFFERFIQKYYYRNANPQFNIRGMGNNQPENNDNRFRAFAGQGVRLN